ncbi:MAG: leucine-rich repeat protein [Bacteroidales bacterium]|nr:leucine-rich repeat protein [Bacteroidales bacterium]
MKKKDTPLKEITFPGSLTSVGVNAFWECTQLESLTFLPSETNTPLNICKMKYGLTDWGTFCDSKLTYINLNRELVYVNENGGKFTPDSEDDGLFYHENYEKVEKTTVILGPQVKTLSYKMFLHLPIEEITIPGTVTTIENNVFEDCTKLKHLTFEPSTNGSALTMGYDDDGDDDGPFIDCPLESVNLNRDISYTFGTPDTDTEGLFGSKPTLTSVVLGEQVKSLTNNMFADAAITEIVIPGSVNTMGNDVFHQCTSLTKVTFEPSEEGTPLTMGYDTDGEDENLFQDNNALTTLVLNREIIQTQTGVNTNSEGLFGGMSTLTSITLGEQVKTLSTYMFAGAAIEEIVIPGTLTSIANNVFDACGNLKTVTFEPSEEGTTLAIGYSGGSSLFASTPLEKVVLDRELNYLFPSDDLNDAAEGLFGNKSTLTSVTLGDNVKTLSPYMFAKSGITTLNLNKVETIADNALANLALTSLTIPGNVMTIENNVFEGCKSLAELVFLPHSEGEALKLGFYDAIDGDGPFYDCPLTTVKLNRELDYTFPLSDLNDPGEGVFGNKTNLVSLTLGEQLKTLSPYMFANIGIKKGVGSSESNVVNANQYVLQLKNVETVGKYAFMGTQITNLKVYPSVSLIDDHAFVNCESLVEVVLEASETPLNLGFQPGSNQHGPFWQSPLASVVLGREIAPTAAYASACDQPDEGIFSNEHSSEEVEGKLPVVQILANVKTLHPYMFSDWAMTSMTIPAFVTEIKDYAFYNCNKLADLTFADSNDDLIVGYQPGSNQRGPFYQSPLTNIVVNRSLVLSDAYASACDAADEGLFSTKHGSQNTTISLGGQVGKIPEFMFASLPLTSITIPATVTEIANDAFTNCKSLKSIIFEESSTPLTIGYNDDSDDDGPFYDSPLETVVLNRELNYTFSSPSSAAEGLFGNKTNLTSVTLGDYVKTISPYMFANAAITELDLNNVTTVGNYAFYHNSAIETVNLRQVTSIGNGAFEGVSKVATLDIPATVTSIGDFAFKGWESLATLNFLSGASDLTIGFQPGTDQRGPFYQSPLTNISVHRSLVLTDAYASACDGVDEGLFSTMHGSQSTTITLGGQVGKIPEFMFASLPLTSITIPATVTEIGNDAFTDCKSLSSVVFEESTTPITVGYNTVGDDEGLFAESPLTSVALYREIEYTFPGPDAVNEGLFGGKENLTNVIINDNVKTISPYMFANSAITALDLKSVETIGNAALMGADFETLTIPASVNSIGDYAFANCESLKNLTFEANTKELTIGFQPGTDEHGPFYQSPLENVVVNRGIALTEAYFKACDSSNEGIFATTHGNQNTSVSLGGLVTSIPKFMFSQLPINTITIPATVNSIGENAFQDCEALTELNFEAGPESLKIYAQWVKISGKTYYAPFYDSPLSKIHLGRDIEYVSDNGNAFVPTVSSHGLFNNDRGGDIERVELTFDPVYGPKTFSPYMFSDLKMESMTIPAYVNEIGNNAFELCDKLSTITFEQSANTLNMGYYVGFGGVIFGDAGPFYSCPLTTVNLYREINYTFGGAVIDDAAEGLFGNKTTLANVTLGDNVKTISPYMFANSAITSLDLKSVVTIGNYALKAADFTSLTIPASVSSIDGYAFYDCSSLSSLKFESGSEPLTIGAQIGSSDVGPFWQSPLSIISLDRELVMDDEYAKYCDDWDEGVFSNKYYDDANQPVAKLSLGNNVKTIHPYMFAATRIQQLHLPESVGKIGKNVIEHCDLLNAIVFYNDQVRPEVETGAFGTAETLVDNNCFLFMPWRTVYRNGASLYYNPDDKVAQNYWHVLYPRMVDEDANNKIEYRIQPHDESLYLDVPGYEWYRKRYKDQEIITPPVF